MRLTEAALRKIVKEEIVALYEGRSNTFMLSRMEETELEEQDRDGDGDSDFDDVRVARFTASGMPKNKAVDKVKRKPLGTTPKKKVNEDVTAIRALVQELLMLNELQFQTGYTSDPRFSSPEPTPSSEPVAVVNSVPVAPPLSSTPGERSAVTVGAFDLSDFIQGSKKRGVKLSSDEGPRVAPKMGASTDHPGIDLVVPEGTAVYTPLAGTVSGVGYGLKLGNYIEIAHGDKFVTRYYHLREIPKLAKNAPVTGGDQIGEVGRTGNVTAKHLHFEVHENEVGDDNKKSQTRLDPIEWLKNNPTATFPVAVTT